MEIHACDPDENIFPNKPHGDAITFCYEENGELWVSNDEYETRVNFCPFCGYTAEKQVPWDKETPSKEK